MGEESLPSVSSASDRALEQAIVALKKGAHLLKYSRRGKPKFCPFKLSMDEKFLIWYSGQVEKKLRLSTVMNIIRGQNTKQLQLEKESQCLSLIHSNGKSSLDLICKDKVQAESWFIGLQAIISRNYQKGAISDTLKKQRGVQSCISSPAAFMRRKQILGLSEYKTRSSEVHSLCGSPPSLFSRSSDSFCSASSLGNTVTLISQNTPLVHKDDHAHSKAICASTAPRYPDSSLPETHVLKDVYIWGEGAGGACLGGSEGESNALQPKLLESTVMLDVRTISLGRKHAALVTKQGEVFCWGEAKRGRLGHKVDIDSLCPKIVDSLTGIHVSSITCGEYQMCALTISGELYTWGDNYTTSSSEVSKISHWLPHRLSGPLVGVAISSVACGEWHTAIVSECGRLFTYGDGTFGTLGHGNLQSYPHPKEVESVKSLRVHTVACGPWHTAAIIENMAGSRGGKLFTWGDSDRGRLGHPDQERKVLLPTYVAQLFDHDFVQVSCGDTITAGLTSTGKVYTFGSAARGQLGVPQARDKSIVPVKGRLADEFVVQVSTGSTHVAVLTSKGNVYTWGNGENGQLGVGDTKDRNSPCLVDALRGRKVERVRCGSSITAAICAHKSVTTADQLCCRGCGNAFGFTRKKRNCYNCGRSFCRSCCSKRSTSACLAPNETKAFRVCNACFNQMQSGVLSSTPRPSPMTRKCYSNAADGMHSFDGDRSSERKDFDIQGKMEPALPRWGRVSCPQIFKKNSFGASGDELSTEPRVRLMNCDSNQSEKHLWKEIMKLKAQVDNLEKLCRTRNEKIEENRHKIEEAWSVAKEEAAKCSEANEMIQALTLKLYETSGGGEEADPGYPQTRIHCKPLVQHEDNDSPIVFSSKFRCNGDVIKARSMESCPRTERTEEYQPGVFITFTALPHGKIGLRRVRFSRKKFNEIEAKRWWEENQSSVYRNYGIDAS